jgi:carbon storage regulator
LLVLTRHVHQSIVIGHDVIVTVLEVRGDQVRLGITAPKDIQVHREEVFAALTAANRQAATSASELEVLKELAPEPLASSQALPRQSHEASASGADAASRHDPVRGAQGAHQAGPGSPLSDGPSRQASKPTGSIDSPSDRANAPGPAAAAQPDAS